MFLLGKEKNKKGKEKYEFQKQDFFMRKLEHGIGKKCRETKLISEVGMAKKIADEED